ncbi:MAG TPA: hypothetical protein VG122_11825 [Gemmata sp.]|nr:hypothetical protein [Gemmata sp.]
MLLTLVLPIAMVAFSPASRVAPELTPTEMLIRLNVQPMAAPKPALRYLLLPELKEMTPGNPIPAYLQCFMDKNFTEQKEILTKSALRQADRAARMDKPDWQLLLKTKTDGIGLLLPDIQNLRFLSARLQERFRSEIAQGRLDDAIVTAKTMFALSRHLGEHPTLIGELVGIAIAQVAIVPLEEMLEQPGCPNLYWALTNLPNPLISLDRGMQGERAMIQAELRDLDDTNPMTPAQLKKLIVHLDALRYSEKHTPIQTWLDARTKDAVLLVTARSRLVEYGIPEERLLKFPAEQLLLLDERREFEVRRDEVMKFMNLPTWQVEEQTNWLKPDKDSPLFDFLVPALQKVRRAQGRLEQRIAMLRHVEALRMYAAEHKGQLPEKLSDVAVPLPVDPFTGKPFRYTLEGATAHLRGNPPPGAEGISAHNLHYEITIASLR